MVKFPGSEDKPVTDHKAFRHIIATSVIEVQQIHIAAIFSTTSDTLNRRNINELHNYLRVKAA
jgi:hypothetical protein